MAEFRHSHGDIMTRMRRAIHDPRGESCLEGWMDLFHDYLMHHEGKSIPFCPFSGRLWCFSDLHTDCPKDRYRNKRWLMQLPIRPNDAVIIAGDVCTSIKNLRIALVVLVERFPAGVFYCPGNHELWTHKGGMNSIQKLLEIFILCDELGVHTTPTLLGDSVAVVPLQGWWMGDQEGVSKRVREGSSIRKYDTMDGLCSWPIEIGDVSSTKNFSITTPSLHFMVAFVHIYYSQTTLIHRISPKMYITVTFPGSLTFLTRLTSARWRIVTLEKNDL